MSQKSVHVTTLIAINIAVILLGLILAFYPASNVSAMNTASNQAVELDEQSVQNSFHATWTQMQNTIFQPISRILTVIGVITMGYLVLSKAFSRNPF
jgi:hypothetical protein